MSERISINISEAAKDYIKDIIRLETKNKGPCGLYISLKKSGCSGYGYNTGIISKSEITNSVEVNKEGISIYIDNLWSSALNNINITIEEGSLNQKQLVFNNPNIDNECGCKESFTVR